MVGRKRHDRAVPGRRIADMIDEFGDHRVAAEHGIEHGVGPVLVGRTARGWRAAVRVEGQQREDERPVILGQGIKDRLGVVEEVVVVHAPVVSRRLG